MKCGNSSMPSIVMMSLGEMGWLLMVLVMVAHHISYQKAAVLFGRSGSMALREIKGRPVSEWPRDWSKWRLAQREIRLWLAHLPIEEIALLDFNNEVSAFPNSSGRPSRLLRIRDDNQEIIADHYGALLDRFDRTEDIEGATNTRAALEAARGYENLSLIILFTDGKSIHAWLPVPVSTFESWRKVTDRLLHPKGGFFGVLGADHVGRVPSQGFRLPGHVRADTGRLQRLLYFNPENVRG